MAQQLSSPAPMTRRPSGAPPHRLLTFFGAWLLTLFSVSACFEGTTEPETSGEAFLVVIMNTGGPAELSQDQRWTLRIRRLDFDNTIDSTFAVIPGDTITLKLPLDSYDLTLDGVPISCEDRSGLERRRFLSVAEGTFVTRFNVFCNTFLAMNVRTTTAIGARADDQYVYRLYDEAGEVLEVGRTTPTDTVLFDRADPGHYALELSHLESNCIPVSQGGRLQRFEIGERRAAVVNFEVVCSNPATAPEIIHFESSYRDGLNVFYMEAVDPDIDGAGPEIPDIDAYIWALTDCKGNAIQTARPRRGLALFGAPTRAQDTVRVAVGVELEYTDAELLGRCTAIRVTDLDGNTSRLVEERIGDEVGAPPTDAGSTAFASSSDRLSFQVSATDPDGDFAGIFQRFVFRDGTFGAGDGQPDVIPRNAYGYQVGVSVPSFAFTSFAFTLEDLVGVETLLIDRQANWSLQNDADLSR